MGRGGVGGWGGAGCGMLGGVVRTAAGCNDGVAWRGVVASRSLQLFLFLFPRCGGSPKEDPVRTLPLEFAQHICQRCICPCFGIISRIWPLISAGSLTLLSGRCELLHRELLDP